MSVIRVTWISILVYGGITYLVVVLLSYGRHFLSLSNARRTYAVRYSIFRRTAHLRVRGGNAVLSRVKSAANEKTYPRNMTVLNSLHLSFFNYKFVSRNPVYSFDHSLIHNPDFGCLPLRFPLPVGASDPTIAFKSSASVAAIDSASSAITAAAFADAAFRFRPESSASLRSFEIERFTGEPPPDASAGSRNAAFEKTTVSPRQERTSPPDLVTPAGSFKSPDGSHDGSFKSPNGSPGGSFKSPGGSFKSPDGLLGGSFKSPDGSHGGSFKSPDGSPGGSAESPTGISSPSISIPRRIEESSFVASSSSFSSSFSSYSSSSSSSSSSTTTPPSSSSNSPSSSPTTSFTSSLSSLFSSPPPSLPPSPVFLLVLVCSSSNHSSARDAIRRTWAKPQTLSHARVLPPLGGRGTSPLAFNDPNSQPTTSSSSSSSSPLPVRVFFLLGLPRDADTQAAIDAESRVHGDVVQFDFMDTYDNLTLKTVMGLKWATKFCPSAQHVLKADDDVIVNVDALVATLKRRRLKRSIMGHVFTKGSFVMRDATNKWFVPSSIYPHFKFPPYVDGPAYVMSGDVVPKLAARADKFPFLFLEDVFVTGMLTMGQNVRLVSNDRFKVNPSPPFNLCNFFSNVALHNVDYSKEESILRVWKSFEKFLASAAKDGPDCSLAQTPPVRSKKSWKRMNVFGFFNFLL